MNNKKRKLREKEKKKKAALLKAITPKETQLGKAVYQNMRKRGGRGGNLVNQIKAYNDTAEQVATKEK